MFKRSTQFKILSAGILAFSALIAFPSLKNNMLSSLRTKASGETYSITLDRPVTDSERVAGTATYSSRNGTGIDFKFPSNNVYTMSSGVLQLRPSSYFYNDTRITGITSIDYTISNNKSAEATLSFGNDLSYLNVGSESMTLNTPTTIDFENPIDFFKIEETTGNGSIFINYLKIYFSCSNDYQYLEDREVASNDLFHVSTLEQSFSWAYVAATKCLDVANSSSGYSFHLTVSSNASGWPTWNYNFGSAVVSSSYDIEFYAKGIGHTTYNLMLLDSSNANILNGNVSFDVTELWEKFTLSNFSLASGKSLADVQKVKLSANYGTSVGTERHLYLDQLKLINVLENPSRCNLEMVEYTRANTTQTALATYEFNEVCGSSTTSRKLDYATATGFGNSDSSTFRAFATFNVEASLGSNNGIDAKNSTLSFDIKFSDTFLSSPDSRVGTPTLDVTDSAGTTATLWNISFSLTSGWIHFSKNLSGSLTTLNGNTKTLRFGFYGVYTGNLSEAQIYIDNLALTAN